MKLFILAVGHKMPGWIASGFDEYTKRMPPELRIELREIKPELRSGGRSAESVMAAERQKIEAALPKGARLVALDERGRDWTTMQLAQALPGWQQDGRDVAFVIGGADGLDPELKARADTLLRISMHDAAARDGARAARRTALPGVEHHAESPLPPRMTCRPRDARHARTPR